LIVLPNLPWRVKGDGCRLLLDSLVGRPRVLPIESKLESVAAPLPGKALRELIAAAYERLCWPPNATIGNDNAGRPRAAGTIFRP
jgi:hypothetical protein